MNHRWVTMLLFLLITACTNDKPEPEGFKFHQKENKQAKMVVGAMKNESRNFQVRHHVNGNNVYVECYIPNFTFNGQKQSKKEGEGHLMVFVDGKKMSDIYSAAFVIKGLAKGNHLIKVELAYNDSTSYKLSKEWKVNITGAS